MSAARPGDAPGTRSAPSAPGRLFDREEFAPPPAYEVALAADRWVAQVVFNRPLESAYDYAVPEGLVDQLHIGERVRAPFGRGDRPLTGYCVGLRRRLPEDRPTLKSVESILDRQPIVDHHLLELTRWIADTTLCGWGQVLDAVIPAGVKSQAGTREHRLFELAPPSVETPAGGSPGKRLSAKQQAVLDVLRTAGRPLDAAELTEAAGCGTAPIAALREKGLIREVRERDFRAGALDEPACSAPDAEELKLSFDQQSAVKRILAAVHEPRVSRTFLLHGVTGSGKTEVYIRAIQEVVAYGRQAIVLVPEISLTPQTIRRFRSRFSGVAVLHSHLTDAERHAQWQRIARGDVPVVVGARSAIFAPCPRLGLIVIDEEHESSFKQDTTPRYHARDVARERARQLGIPLVLGSATPTLESWHRAQQKLDELISMPRRVGQLSLPPVIIVDTRNDPFVQKGAAIGRALFTAIQRALVANGQVILFLNVRGYSPVFWCRACGEGVRCPHCDLTLTWHKARQVALCHSCDFHQPPPATCPNCGHAGLRNLGLGTERLEDEVRTRFPAASVLRMDSDTMQRRGSHDEALEAFRHGQVQILLGTQMIAKGLDFPNVTLVGVIDADTLLHQPDLRAAERTFQLIAQVAGRTGRGPAGGRVLVQTASPEQSAIVQAANHNYVAFATEELGHRLALGVPPYLAQIRLVLRGEVEVEARQSADELAALLRERMESCAGARVLGPAPCPVARLRGMFRFQIQLFAPQMPELRALCRAALEHYRERAGVEWIVDVDPINLR